MCISIKLIKAFIALFSINLFKKQHTVVIADFSAMGGTRTYFLQLISFLKSSGTEFICWIPEDQADEKMASYLKEQKIVFFTKKNGFKLSVKNDSSKLGLSKNLINVFFTVWRLNRFISSKNCNKIIITTAYNDEYMYMLLLPVKVIYINHTLAYYNSNILNRKILNTSLSEKKQLVGVSQCSIDSMLKYYHVDTTNRKYCKILFNYSTISVNCNRKFEQKKAFTITSVGHLENYKNPHLWIEIAKKITTSNFDYTLNFYWAGEGSLLDDCKKIARGFNNIQFLGLVNDVPALMNKTDIYIQTSDIESFGLAALDAIANGIPVLLKNTTGLSELVEDHKTGFLFDTEEEAVSRLSFMIHNYSTLNKVTSAAKETQEKKYSFSSWQKNFNALLND